MSIKTTVTLSRRQAEILLRQRIHIPTLTDEQLEGLLEELDESDGNPFTNYSITKEKDE